VCGRYTGTSSARDLSALFEPVDETGGGVKATYNIAPTSSVPIVTTGPDSDGVIERTAELAQPARSTVLFPARPPPRSPGF
jgi:putative SOS response-associated peptidase YedK